MGAWAQVRPLFPEAILPGGSAPDTLKRKGSGLNM